MSDRDLLMFVLGILIGALVLVAGPNLLGLALLICLLIVLALMLRGRPRGP